MLRLVEMLIRSPRIRSNLESKLTKTNLVEVAVNSISSNEERATEDPLRELESFLDNTLDKDSHSI